MFTTELENIVQTFRHVSAMTKTPVSWRSFELSFREWHSRNGRVRLRLYSDDTLYRIDKLTGETVARQQNVMVELEDRDTGQIQRFIAEQCVDWEDERHVYYVLRGRRVHQTEPLSTHHRIPIPRRNRQPIRIYDDR